MIRTRSNHPAGRVNEMKLRQVRLQIQVELIEGALKVPAEINAAFCQE